MGPELKLRFAQPSESQRSRNRFRYRNAPKQPTRNIVDKKRAGQEDLDSDYLFANSSSFLPKVRLILPLLYVVKLTFLELHLPTLKPLNFPLQTPHRP